MKKAEKCHALSIVAALLAVTGLAVPAIAETKPTYDKRIEEAAIRMLIPKLGEMRGSLGLGATDYLVPLAKERVIEKQAAEVPAPLPQSRSSGSFVFF